jgi:glycosyltransferase involved in cell wall biosynthesis
MPTTPLISIGMSVRNNAASLPLTLRSILRQTCTDWELILIDDGSTDNTLAVARCFADPRINLLTDSTSRGLAHRLNQAVDLARGRFFARMDGDDVCFPKRLALQSAFLASHPEIDLLGSGGVVFSGEGEALGLRHAPTVHEDICARPWSGFYLAHPSWMGRTEWFRRHRYDERALKAQDYDLLLRTHCESRFAALPDLLIGYREERLDVWKNLASRRQTVMAQWRYARTSRQWWELFLAMAGQTVKGAVELAVIGTALERRMLGHRAAPIDPAAARAWQTLWKELMQKDVERCVA